uniref:Cdc37 N-terminal domain-containing protein n=1 Tax=Scleropages formosus TaxID=113540 RepID=A0A8C9QX89_SCLFO
MTTTDYSRWDHIEVSQGITDESDLNVDTPSLFRWRHQVHPTPINIWCHVFSLRLHSYSIQLEVTKRSDEI